MCIAAFGPRRNQYVSQDAGDLTPKYSGYGHGMRDQVTAYPSGKSSGRSRVFSDIQASKLVRQPPSAVKARRTHAFSAGVIRFEEAPSSANVFNCSGRHAFSNRASETTVITYGAVSSGPTSTRADAQGYAAAAEDWRAAGHQHPEHDVAALARLVEAGEPGVSFPPTASKSMLRSQTPRPIRRMSFGSR